MQEAPEEPGEKHGKGDPGNPSRQGCVARQEQQEGGAGQGKEQKGVQRERVADLSMEQEMGGPESAADGAVQTGHGMKRTAGIEGVFGGVEEKQQNGRRQAKERQQAPNESAGRARGHGAWRESRGDQALGGFLPRRARTAFRSSQQGAFLLGSRSR